MLIFERKIFRRIYGAKYENGEWKSGTNRELDEMSKGENIVKWIKGQTISWLGHLERTEEDRMPKKIFTQELEGTRRRGRPRRSSTGAEWFLFESPDLTSRNCCVLAHSVSVCFVRHYTRSLT